MDILGAISLLKVVLRPPQFVLKTFPEHMNNCNQKESHIGSVVKEILWYKQTPRLPLLLYQDVNLEMKNPVTITNEQANKLLNYYQKR